MRTEDLLQLQRSAGNRAVARLLDARGAADTNHLQRYAVIPVEKQKKKKWAGENADLRVSDDGKMAVKHVNGTPNNTRDYQVFYATPDILQYSQQRLTATNSAFTIAAGGKTLVGKPPGARKGKQTLYQAVVTNQDLAKQGKGDYAFNACNANMTNFLGILRTTTTDPDKLSYVRDITLKLQNAMDQQAKVIHFEERDFTFAMQEARRLVTNSKPDAPTKNAYNKMEESARKLASEQLGINEHALPDVGEGWGIMVGGKGGQTAMGHYAPVIGVSGDDRVTLENDVSQGAQRENSYGEMPINPTWYFRMFGPLKKKEDQTFWGEARKYEGDQYGDRPLVASLGSQAPNRDKKKDEI